MYGEFYNLHNICQFCTDYETKSYIDLYATLALKNVLFILSLKSRKTFSVIKHVPAKAEQVANNTYYLLALKELL